MRRTAGNEGSVSCQRTKRRTWKVLTKDAAAGAARGPAQLELLQERVLHAFTKDSLLINIHTRKRFEANFSRLDQGHVCSPESKSPGGVVSQHQPDQVKHLLPVDVAPLLPWDVSC